MNRIGRRTVICMLLIAALAVVCTRTRASSGRAAAADTFWASERSNSNWAVLLALLPLRAIATLSRLGLCV